LVVKKLVTEKLAIEDLVSEKMMTGNGLGVEICGRGAGQYFRGRKYE
jgi:hypothetical protein